MTSIRPSPVRGVVSWPHRTAHAFDQRAHALTFHAVDSLSAACGFLRRSRKPSPAPSCVRIISSDSGLSAGPPPNQPQFGDAVRRVVRAGPRRPSTVAAEYDREPQTGRRRRPLGRSGSRAMPALTSGVAARLEDDRPGRVRTYGEHRRQQQEHPQHGRSPLAPPGIYPDSLAFLGEGTSADVGPPPVR